MRRHAGRGDGNSLMQVAAAVVGSAAAAQVVTGGTHVNCSHDPNGYVVGGSMICAPRPAERDEVAHWKAEIERMEREAAKLRARVAELEQAEVDRELTVHAALNTYEVSTGTLPGAESVTSSLFVVVGANHRRLLARWQDDGVWVGGCLIADREAAQALSAFITRGSDE